MAVVIGNLASVVDALVNASGKLMRPVVLGDGVVLVNARLPKRDFYQIIANTYASIGAKGFESEGKGGRKRLGGRGRSKTNWIDFEESSDEEGYESENEKNDEEEDWDEEMRKRMKEMEERRELEKKAEELQSKLIENGEESEEEKRMRVRRELEKVAKEQEECRATAKLMFDIGQKAYGRGMYGRAIEFFEGALTIIPRSTVFGGEIQIWLAMAYEANNRHGDCIALYRSLEAQHPSFSIRRQASDLRYILQAPKLKISQDEMVTIPLIGSSYDSYAATWSDKNKDIDKKRSESVTNQLPSTKDYLADFLIWRPPTGLEKSQAFWATLTLWLSLIGAALLLNDNQCPHSISLAAFAEKIVSQSSRSAGIAFATGHVIVLVTSQVPHAMDIILAEFHKACIYTVPKHISYSKSVFTSRESYLKALGYREVDGKIESGEDFLKRVESCIKLYAALIQTQVNGVKNPHGLEVGWTWLATLLNTLPASIYTAVALESFLKMAGYAMYRKYKVQFIKLLDVISHHFLKSLRERNEPGTGRYITSIQSYIEDKVFLQEPEGWKLQGKLLSHERVPTSDPHQPQQYGHQQYYRQPQQSRFYQ